MSTQKQRDAWEPIILASDPNRPKPVPFDRIDFGPPQPWVAAEDALYREHARRDLIKDGVDLVLSPCRWPTCPDGMVTWRGHPFRPGLMYAMCEHGHPQTHFVAEVSAREEASACQEPEEERLWAALGDEPDGGQSALPRGLAHRESSSMSELPGRPSRSLAPASPATPRTSGNGSNPPSVSTATPKYVQVRGTMPGRATMEDFKQAARAAAPALTIYNRRLLNKAGKPNPYNSFYVGRPSDWGNRDDMLRESDRDRVCDAFEVYAAERLKREPGWLKPLVGKSLVCWCWMPGKRRRCHAETLLRIANGLTPEQVEAIWERDYGRR